MTCSLKKKPGVELNRALQQKHFEIAQVGRKAKNLHSTRSRTVGSFSEGDLNSVASFATSRSKITVKSDVCLYRGRSLRVRNSGGLPSDTPLEFTSTLRKKVKRKKILNHRERRAKAKKKACLSAIKNSFKSSQFEDQVKFWAKIDATELQDLVDFED